MRTNEYPRWLERQKYRIRLRKEARAVAERRASEPMPVLKPTVGKPKERLWSPKPTVLLGTADMVVLTGKSTKALEHMRRRGTGPRFKKDEKGHIVYRKDDVTEWLTNNSFDKG